MNCSTPGLPVHHQLPEFTQTHVHWVSDALFEYIEPQINGAHQWTLRRPCSQIFPLEIHLWYELKSCYRGKGLHQKNECRQLLLVVRSGPQSYNRAPSLVLLLCVESMCKEHRNSTSTGPSEGKRLIWCRASKSKILCVTKILENTKRQMQKDMKERQTQPGI